MARTRSLPGDATAVRGSRMTMRNVLELIPSVRWARAGRRQAVVPAPASDASVYRAIFERSVAGMAVLDERGRIRESNTALAAALALPASVLPDRYIGELVIPEDQPRLELILQELRRGVKSADHAVLRCLGAGRQVVWLDTHVFRRDDGGFVIEMQDGSARRRADEELRRAQSQLMRTEKLAAIGHLAAGVAHQIDEPLGYVSSNLNALGDYVRGVLRIVDAYEVVERAAGGGAAWNGVRAVRAGVDVDFVRGDVVALLEESQEGIRRASTVVQDLKEFSRPDTGDDWQAADLHQGLDSALNMVMNEVRYKAVVEKAYGVLPPVRCVRSDVNQVFMSILVNAVQSIAEDGLIRITTGAEGDQVWIDISDNGHGIPPECLERVFEPFFTTRAMGSATGLGLSVAHAIVQKHHGRIDVESTPGCGTRFRVWLPIDPNAA